MTALDRTELFETYIHLADRIAYRFMRYGKTNVEFDDLRQEALISLYKASDKYDPSRGKMSFEKFAVTYVFFNVMKWMYRQNYYYTPKTVVEVAATINKRKIKDWDAQAIADNLGASMQYVEAALIHLNNRKPRSMDEPTAATAGTRQEEPLYSLISDHSDNYNPVIIDFKIFTSALKPREKAIVRMTEEGYSQTEIAKKLNTSQAQVSRTIIKVKNRYNEFSVIS